MMRKLRRKGLSLLMACALLLGMTSIPSYAADQETEPAPEGGDVIETQGEGESLWVCGTCVYDGTNVNNSLAGASYDPASATLTLDNFSGTMAEVQEAENRHFAISGIAGIEAVGIPELTICLRGVNTIGGNSGDEDSYGIIYEFGQKNTKPGLLKITGDGSLSLNLEGGRYVNGIQVGCFDGFRVESGTLNINAINASPTLWFYGISRPVGMREKQPFTASFDILGGTVNINCSDMPEFIQDSITGDRYRTNVRGIETRDTNLNIRNAELNITIGTASYIYAIASGEWKSYGYDEEAGGDTSYVDGGAVTVENAVVNIKTQKPADSFLNAYMYKLVNPGNENIYVGTNVLSKKVTVEEAFYVNEEFAIGRMDLEYCCLTISPEEIELQPEFVDVPASAWFYDAVYYVAEKEAMTGKDSEHFAPTETLVRAQFASVLHKMNEQPKMEYKGLFSDVTKDDWFKDAVLWAAEGKIVTGYTGSDLFGSNDQVTRAQMATMLYRYAKEYCGYTLKEGVDYDNFPDAGSVQSFAVDALRWAVAEGIITGKTINGQLLLDPQGSASRAECATIIKRFIEKYES